MRRLLMLLILCTFPLGAAGSGKKLRLASWNVHNLCDEQADGWGDPELEPWLVQEKLNRVARVVTSLRAGVLAVQDVEKARLLQRLAAQTGYSWCVAHEGRHGLGLLSRLPVLGYRTVADGRCLEVHLEQLVVMVCHLRDPDQPRQAWQVAMRCYELQREQSDRLLAVVGGVQTLESLRQVHMLDALSCLPYEERSGADHILLGRELAPFCVPGSARVIRSKQVEATSDHYPLVVELQGRSERRAKRDR